MNTTSRLPNLGMIETVRDALRARGPGDIEQAHKPNEYVAFDQLVACERFLLKFIHSMSVDAHA
jgi:acetylornithine deacetylase/succinyl-diaminopimelate desuccinylase-like protein